MKKSDIKNLYYITHIENLPSILDRGILSHTRIEALNVPFTPIYDSAIVSKRKDRLTPDRKSLWDYANLYFQPRNPMMYRVVHDKGKQDLAVLRGARALGMITVQMTGIIARFWLEVIEQRRQHADFRIDNIASLISDA